jgi:hypothetical protein
MTRNIFIKLVVTLVIVFFTMGAVVSAATVAASGKINTIDFAKKTIAVKLSGGKKLTLIVPASASIKRNGASAALNALGLNDDIAVKFESGKKMTISLSARGPKFTLHSGSLKAIDARTGVIMVGFKNFRINSSTKIARNGQVVAVSQLTCKDDLVLHIQTGTNFACDILSCGPDEKEIAGLITAIQPGTDKISIAPWNGAPVISLTVDADTIINLNCHPATLGELQTGMRVEVDYNPLTNVTFSIEADTECKETSVQGTVAVVDSAAGTLIVKPGAVVDSVAGILITRQSDAGALTTLTANAATEIEANGVHAFWADIQVGMPITVEYHPFSLIAKNIEAGSDDTDCYSEKVSDIIGVVSAVGSVSITIVPHDGTPLTLNLDGSTKIEFSDTCEKAATIIDIPIGGMVEAEYEVNTMLARKIEIDLDCSDYDCGDDNCGDDDCGDNNCNNDNCGDDDCGNTDCGDDSCDDHDCENDNCDNDDCTNDNCDDDDCTNDNCDDDDCDNDNCSDD